MDGWCPGGVKYRAAYAAKNNGNASAVQVAIGDAEGRPVAATR